MLDEAGKELGDSVRLRLPRAKLIVRAAGRRPGLA